jgi:hypothetical protein
MTAWPDLSGPTLQPTCETLRLMAQVAGKVRLVQSPWLNHSWHVPLYVTARGLSTSLIPHARGAFDLEFDFAAGLLRLRTEAGEDGAVALKPGSIADFHARVMGELQEAGVPAAIDPMPNEIPGATPFDRDHAERPYDPQAATAFWRALVRIDEVFKLFRTGFLGKASPAHFFWGSFDLAVTRFSGRPAPPHPGGVPNLPDAVAREAYSHEVSSAGFWPGGDGVEPSFYSYAYPEPQGFRTAEARPAGARFDETLGEFLLPYEAVRSAVDPQVALLDFLTSTYEAAADAAAWDRKALECELGRPGAPRPV